MSSVEWELEPDSEREILLAWLEREPDPETRERVVDYIAGLASNPDRRWLYEEDPRVYAVKAVPGTNIGITWTLNWRTHEIVLAFIV